MQGGIERALTERTPDAPFKTMDERGWPKLAMTRILQYAIENDYDRISWSPGHVQKLRYGAPEAPYDKTIPKVVNNALKKLSPGTKITEDLTIQDKGQSVALPSIKINSAMRSSIKRLGQAIMALPPVALAAQTVTSEQPAATPTQ